MKLIYVCAPYSGAVEKNVNRAKEYARRILEFEPDATPIVPHLMFEDIFDEDKQRAEVMEACKAVLSRCDELWVFGLRISQGMAEEVIHALSKGIKLRQLVPEEERPWDCLEEE